MYHLEIEGVEGFGFVEDDFPKAIFFRIVNKRARVDNLIGESKDAFGAGIDHK